MKKNLTDKILFALLLIGASIYTYALEIVKEESISIDKSKWDFAIEANVESQYMEIKTPRGIIQPFVIQSVNKAKGNIVLLNGGKGNINLKETSGKAGRANFLSRSRNLFLNAGYNIIQVYLPQDKQKGMYTFRTSNEHASDLQVVIQYLKEKYSTPIWVAGTSFSGVSAVNLATKDNHIDGIILAAVTVYDEPNESKWKKKFKQRVKKLGKSYQNMKIGLVDTSLVKTNVIYLHNKADKCATSKVENESDIVTIFPNANNLKIISVDGGSHINSKDWKRTICGGLSEHGFYKIEKKAIQLVLNELNK